MSSAQVPPGPAWPRPLATLAWITRPNAVLERCRARYGDIFSMKIAYAGDWVFLGSPNAVRDVFTADPAVAHAGAGNDVLRPVLGHRSVLLLDEAAHLAHRRVLLPPFHGARLERFETMMADVTREQLAGWPLGSPVQLWPRMQAITLEIILHAVLGIREPAQRAAWRDAIVAMLEFLMRARPMLMLATLGPDRVERWRLLRRVLDPVDRLLRAEVRGRRARGTDGDDILSLLLSARQADGSELPEDVLRDEIMTLLMAGHETTATSIAWAFERLARGPYGVRPPDAAQVDAIVKETLRLRPPIPVVVRRLQRPLAVGGHELPAGVLVAPSAHLVHRRADLYPDPHSFRPERFLGQRPGTYTWIPFGGGVRRCLGAGFAMLEMRVVITEVLRRLVLEPVGPPERPTRRAVTLVPQRRAEVVARAR